MGNIEREDAILLLANGAFCVGSLLLLLYLPKNAAYSFSNWTHTLLYVPPFICFMVFLKMRRNINAAVVLTWVACALFCASAALFGIGALYSAGGVMIGG